MRYYTSNFTDEEIKTQKNWIRLPEIIEQVK